jgi:predicted GTPase
MSSIISVAIIGPVSAGKSTLMNALFARKYSDTALKRTTMNPQVYTSDSVNYNVDKEIILKVNRAQNSKLINDSENGIKLESVNESHHCVNEWYDIVSLHEGVNLRIYDIPGLNDRDNDDIYFKYMSETFHKFDIVILMIDVNSALNTPGELKILKFVVEHIKKSDAKRRHARTDLIVLVNKCDDMSYNDNKKLCVNSDQKEMVDQVEKILDRTINEIYVDLSYHMIPISCEDAFISRIYKRYPSIKLEDKFLNKIGINNFGKRSWSRLNSSEKSKKL